MASPQQGTETSSIKSPIDEKPRISVNGLTPTGDGNIPKYFSLISIVVLMASPQQGTETNLRFQQLQ